MAAPTASDVDSWSQVDFAALGVDATNLTRLTTLAIALLRRWTGQFWDASNGGLYTGLAPAEGTEPMAQDVVRQLVEVAAEQSTEDRAEGFADFDTLTSFSAGGYSENRRSGKDFQEATAALLHRLFWPLMDYAHQDQWMQMMGQVIPGFEVTEMDWQSSNGISSLAWDNNIGWGPGW